MEIGSLAEWFAGTGTAGALLISLYLLRSEMQLRIRAQANRISTWAEWDRRDQSNPRGERQYFAYIDNSSDAPVYVGLMRVSRNEGEAPLITVKVGTIAAHDRKEYGLPIEDFLPSGNPPYIEICFLDADRTEWRRDSRAHLTPVKRAAPKKA